MPALTPKKKGFIMPNGKRLRATGRFSTSEELYHEVRRDYYETPTARNLATVARWANISITTAQNILNGSIKKEKV